MYSPKKAGFTLIELLIVVAIAGILAAIVIGAINPGKRQNQAKDAKIKADFDQIITGLAAYYTTAVPQSYPVNLGKLVTSRDLKSLPAPNGGTYEGGYQALAADNSACDETLAPCTKAKLSFPLYDPQVSGSGNVWCWLSTLGKAQELVVAACTL